MPSYLFKFFDVGKTSQPAGDGAGWQRFAFLRSHDTDHVHDFSAFSRFRRNARDLQLTLFQSESFKGEPALLEGQPPVIVGDRHAEDTRLGDDQKGDGVNGSQSSRRQNRPLHAFLPALGDKGSQIAEVAEIRFIYARFCANGRRLAYLSDDHANLSRGHLHPRMFGHGVNHEQFEAQSGHQQLGLVSGLAVEGHWIVAWQLGSESLAHQADLCRPDAVDGPGNENDKENDECDNELTGQRCERLYAKHASSLLTPRSSFSPAAQKFLRRSRLLLLEEIGANFVRWNAPSAHRARGEGAGRNRSVGKASRRDTGRVAHV